MRIFMLSDLPPEDGQAQIATRSLAALFVTPRQLPAVVASKKYPKKRDFNRKNRSVRKPKSMIFVFDLNHRCYRIYLVL